GLVTGNGRRNRELTKLKIAVLAPMPNASVITATRVNPGFFSSIRKPKRRSCQSICIISSSENSHVVTNLFVTFHHVTNKFVTTWRVFIVSGRRPRHERLLRKPTVGCPTCGSLD